MQQGKHASLAPMYIAAGLIAAGVIYLLLILLDVRLPFSHR